MTARTVVGAALFAATLSVVPLTTSDAVSTPDSRASGPFRIAQIHYKQGATLNSEYIVTKNITSHRQRLSGFRVVDPQDGPRYTFRSTALRAGRSVVLHTGHGNNNPGDRYWHRDTAVWNNDGDTALLKNRAGVTVDRCTYQGGGVSTGC